MRRKSQYAVAFLSFRLLIWKLCYKTKIFPTSCTCRYSCICNWGEILHELGLTIPKKAFLIQSQKDQCTTKLQGLEHCKMTSGPCPRSASGLAQKVPFGSLSLASNFLFQLQFLLFIYPAERVLPCPGTSPTPTPCHGHPVDDAVVCSCRMAVGGGSAAPVWLGAPLGFNSVFL